jgi:hypothetical protein
MQPATGCKHTDVKTMKLLLWFWHHVDLYVVANYSHLQGWAEIFMVSQQWGCSSGMDGKNPKNICNIMKTDISVHLQESQFQCHDIILGISCFMTSAALVRGSYAAPWALAPVDTAGNRIRAHRCEDDLPGLCATETHQQMPTLWDENNIFRAEGKFEVPTVVRMEITMFYMSAPHRCTPKFPETQLSPFSEHSIFLQKQRHLPASSHCAKPQTNKLITLITAKTSNLM